MSVFQKLKNLAKSNEVNKEEDFLTEIFAHALATDAVFWRLFYGYLWTRVKSSILTKDIPAASIPVVETQKFYANNLPHHRERIPDIEINLPDAVIIIENKIGTGEGDLQLSDYAKILNVKANKSVRLLVYLTAVHDEKQYDFTEDNVLFISMRWQNIGEIISRDCGQFTQALKDYLKNEKLMMKKFDYQDLAAINVFFSTAAKINSIILDDINPNFVQVKKLAKWNALTPKINVKEYGFYYNYGTIVTICFGIASWWEDEHPCLIVKVKFLKKTAAQHKLSNAFFEALGGKASKWYQVEPVGGNEYIVETKMPLYTFLSKDEQHQREDITAFYKSCIEDMHACRGQFPEIFGNSTPEPVLE